jgi:LytTr DNA-binding domain
VAHALVMHLPCQPISGEVPVGINAGMNGRPLGTDGDLGVTNGSRSRLAIGIVLTIIAINAVISAVSVADQLPTAAPWEPWVWEFTSAAFFAALLVPLWRLVRRMAGWRWPKAVAVLLVLSGPVAALHLGWLWIMRSAIYALLDSSYHLASPLNQLVFEWRKDALTLLLLAGLGWLLDRVFAAPVSLLGPVPEPAPFRLAVKDGSRTLLLAPDEISHASSAGNYVELATRHGTVLHRVTLAALETELAPHGFVRIHRAHIVRIAAVVAVERSGSGDFGVTLGDGTRLPGSRRWRNVLAQL